MKKYPCLIILSIFLLNLITACSKSNGDAPKDSSASPKDYAASLNDKTWAGVFTYGTRIPEYYSIHFNADNSFTWNELSGDYSGHWVVNGKQLVWTFTSGSEVKADISDDDRLINITNSAHAYAVNSGKLVPKADFALENTLWKGTVTMNGGSYPLELNFLTGSKVSVSIDKVIVGQWTYERTSSGGSFAFVTEIGDKFFSVITSDNEMMGSDTKAANPWRATKQ